MNVHLYFCSTVSYPDTKRPHTQHTMVSNLFNDTIEEIFDHDKDNNFNLHKFLLLKEENPYVTKKGGGGGGGGGQICGPKVYIKKRSTVKCLQYHLPFHSVLIVLECVTHFGTSRC